MSSTNKPGKEIRTAEEILLEHIKAYNATVNDMSKFSLNANELKTFSEAMEEYASQFRDKEVMEPAVEQPSEPLATLACTSGNSIEQILTNLHNREIFFRLENDEEGFYLSIIDRSVYPRIFSDTLNDNAEILSESTDSLLNRTLSPSKDWIDRYFGETIPESISQMLKKYQDNPTLQPSSSPTQIERE